MNKLTDCPSSISIVGPLAQASILTKAADAPWLGRGVERVLGYSYYLSLVSRRHHPLNQESRGNHENGRTPEAIITFPDDLWNDVIFDDFDENNLKKKLWCAPVYKSKESEEEAETSRVLGLLLEQVEETSFRRIGAFSVEDLPSGFDFLPSSMYMIV
jgi:hypothetical protein